MFARILAGGVDVPSQPKEVGLVDEYRFVIGPTVRLRKSHDA